MRRSADPNADDVAAASRASRRSSYEVVISDTCFQLMNDTMRGSVRRHDAACPREGREIQLSLARPSFVSSSPLKRRKCRTEIITGAHCRVASVNTGPLWPCAVIDHSPLLLLALPLVRARAFFSLRFGVAQHTLLSAMREADKQTQGLFCGSKASPARVRSATRTESFDSKCGFAFR